tara:strand:- start:69 stop:944 length:876 start_codon:yes stop_codon:yes gene_type:complete
MKILIILFGSLFLLFVSSCKSDDNGNNTVVIGEKYISEIRTTQYKSDGGQIGYTIKEYENNKPIIETNYSENNNVRYTSVWNYTDDKLEYFAKYQNTGPDLFRDQYIEYDSINRIKSIHLYNWQLVSPARIFFTYNSNNTITKKYVDLGTPQDTTYFTLLLNERGLIYKQGGVDLIYDNDNNVVTEIITYQNEIDTINLTYDHINLPPSGFSVCDDIYGGIQNNSILAEGIQGTMIGPSLLSKFLLKREAMDQQVSNDLRWVWNLDNENYPLIMKRYQDTILRAESEYFFD